MGEKDSTQNKAAADGASCLVQRVGLVTMVGPDDVTALINGRTLLLAAEKVAEGVKAGDAILWNGKIWTASNGAATGTSNMRKA